MTRATARIKRAIDFLIYRAKFNWPQFNKHRPIHLDLELTRTCNLTCPFCYRQSAGWKSKSTVMDGIKACRILSDAYRAGFRSVKLNWRGEPSLYDQDKFAGICRYAHDIGYLDILVNTNGVIPLSKNALPNITEIRVSLDTMVPELYKTMRPPATLDQVIATLKFYQAEFSGRLIIQRRTTQFSEDEFIFRQALIAEGVNADKIESRPVQPRGTNRDPSYHEIWRRGLLERKYCKQPSQRIVVGADGKAFACCLAYDEPDALFLGHTDTTHFGQLINNYLRIDLINALQENDFSVCRTCERCTSPQAYQTRQ